jgi:antitoxin (DNA-binding transcriptional repressor) of toxin-antitoxin stability system
MTRNAIEVPATTLVRHFADFIAKVRYGGKTVIVMKNKARVAELRPWVASECTLAGLAAIWNITAVDDRFADDLERVNRSDRPPKNPRA